MFGYGQSMRGSGIDSYTVEYDDFTCENEDCAELNTNAVKVVDDWGAWAVECSFCLMTHAEGHTRDRD